MPAVACTLAQPPVAIVPSIALFDHFARLDDPRQSAKVVFPLPEIMLLVLSATIAGCDDLVEVCEWGRERLDFLRRYLLFRDDIPSHDTLTDVVNALDPEVFKACFMDWVACLRDGDPDTIAVDGKTSCRTHDKTKDRKPAVSCFGLGQPPKSKTSLKVRRKKAGWNADYLGDILRGAG